VQIPVPSLLANQQPDLYAGRVASRQQAQLRLRIGFQARLGVLRGKSILMPNVRANRTAAAGWLGPGCENVPRTAGRAKTARRSGSGGSARC